MDPIQNIGIRIKTMDSKVTELECNLEMSVNDLKLKIQELMQVPYDRQRLIYQGKLMENNELLSKYKIQHDFVIHLIAHLPVQEQNSQQSIDELVTSTQDISRDLEILTSILRTLRQTSYNRQNLRRVIMQQRGNGFNFQRDISLESIKQNFDSLEQMLQCRVSPNEIPPSELKQKNVFINPYRFGNKKMKIGQWIDLKDTIDQWLEAQVIDIKDNKIYVHYNGWGRRWDEWVDIDSPRVALFRTYTVGSPNQQFMSPTPVNDPDADLRRNTLDLNEFIFDVGFQMNQVTAMLIEFGKYQNFKKLKEKQLELLRQQRRVLQQYNCEEKKDQGLDDEDKEEEIRSLSNKSSLMSSQLGPIFDRLGRMMIDLAPHFAIMGQQTQTIQENTHKTSVFQVPIILTPNELNQTQSSQFNVSTQFDQLSSQLHNLRQVLVRQVNDETVDEIQSQQEPQQQLSFQMNAMNNNETQQQNQLVQTAIDDDLIILQQSSPDISDQEYNQQK